MDEINHEMSYSAKEEEYDQIANHTDLKSNTKHQLN